MRNICIIGSGHVGLVTGACFATLGNKVICVDSDKEKIEKLKQGFIPFYEPNLEDMVRQNIKEGRLSFTTSIPEGVKESEIIFISVSTPSKPDGEVDLRYVEEVSIEIARAMDSYKVIVEKSTVPVKTGERIKRTIEINNSRNIEFDVVSNPEFLREGEAIHDFMHPDRIVIGVERERAKDIMLELYRPLNAPIIVTDIKSAELIKHASNSFLALKISYINAISQICEKAGADVKEVAKGIGLDKRIGNAFLEAGVGYGGSCFSKDLSAFIKISHELGYDFELLKSVQRINDMQRKRVVEMVKEMLWVLNGKTIGILGLSFKPNTDDMRDAPSITIIEYLQKEGGKIKAYDPKAIDEAKKIIKDIEFSSNPYDLAKGCDCLLILTEWEEFKRLDLKRIKDLLNQPNIIDGRNIFEPKEMKRLGFNYKGIGR